ncbi:MAG: hypothetical protein OHK0013_33460 [Sandaracinaceae bacterium]
MGAHPTRHIQVLAVTVRGDWFVAERNLFGQPTSYGLPVYVALTSDFTAEGVAQVLQLSLITTEARPSAPWDGYWAGDTTGRVSGHAHALAIDVLTLVREDGSTFRILDDWLARARGADPCGEFDEPDEPRRVRRLVCDAVERGLFQVVITPHHDDRHANHLHLEVRPGVDWAVIR